MNIVIACNWLDTLAASERYTKGVRPALRPEVQNWQEDLAMEIKSSMVTMGIYLGPQVVVDVEVFLPRDGIEHDPMAFFKSINEAVEMATGIEGRNLIPFLRSVREVGLGPLPKTDTGFLVRLYSAHFGGINLTGTISHFRGSGQTVIKLDKPLPGEWDGTRVMLNLGVIRGTHLGVINDSE